MIENGEEEEEMVEEGEWKGRDIKGEEERKRGKGMWERKEVVEKGQEK